jgi:hypothetical protein
MKVDWAAEGQIQGNFVVCEPVQGQASRRVLEMQGEAVCG